MKKLLFASACMLFMGSFMSSHAQEWQTGGGATPNLDNDLFRRGKTNIGLGGTLNSWPAQLQVINKYPVSSTGSTTDRIDLLISRVYPSAFEQGSTFRPYLQIDDYNSLLPPSGGYSFDATRLIFTHDYKLGINTATPEEMLTLHDGSMLIDLENADADHSLGVVLRGQSRPMITAFDSRSSINDRFTSGPYKNAGMFGMLMDGGALTFSIKHDPNDFGYHRFKFVGAEPDGTLQTYMTINENGIVGIGTDGINLHWATGYKLHVKGGIRTNKIKVDIDYGNWPDYVFAADYKLRGLEEVASYVQENKHLPDVPSAKQLSEDGADLAEMDAILLRKIEEMTLYMIELKKENDELKAVVSDLLK